MCTATAKPAAPGAIPATKKASSAWPWYLSGGMQINQIGMGINIALPIIALAQNLPSLHLKAFLLLLASSWILSYLQNRRTLYCIVVVPTFLASLALLLSPTTLHRLAAPTALVLAVSIAIAKVNICMSVCLHRYAAHSAFKCGPLTHCAMLFLGCLANQGGPLWWATQHRCHHKHCDIPRDPHSPILVGTELAFAFFGVEGPNQEVVEEFAPLHLKDGFMLRIIDTWAWMVVFCELGLSYWIGGTDALFLAYTSGWICQTITLWFNVVNHPPDKKEETKSTTATATTTTNSKKNPSVCKATNGKDTQFEDYYIPFLVLDALVPLFSIFVMEAEHEHHHEFARLAKRSKYDIAYWGFVWPLERLGLVWNVVV